MCLDIVTKKYKTGKLKHMTFYKVFQVHNKKLYPMVRKTDKSYNIGQKYIDLNSQTNIPYLVSPKKVYCYKSGYHSFCKKESAAKYAKWFYSFGWENRPKWIVAKCEGDVRTVGFQRCNWTKKFRAYASDNMTIYK